MHVIAAREMKRNGIPIDKYIAVNWLNEIDIKNIGADAAKGLKRGTSVAGGSNQPLVQEIIKELYDKGKGNGDRKNLEDVYYNTSCDWSIASRAYVWPQKDGCPDPQRTRTAWKSKNYDAQGPMVGDGDRVGSCGAARPRRYVGRTKWVPQTDWIAAYTRGVEGRAGAVGRLRQVGAQKKPRSRNESLTLRLSRSDPRRCGVFLRDARPSRTRSSQSGREKELTKKRRQRPRRRRSSNQAGGWISDYTEY